MKKRHSLFLFTVAVASVAFSDSTRIVNDLVGGGATIYHSDGSTSRYNSNLMSGGGTIYHSGGGSSACGSGLGASSWRSRAPIFLTAPAAYRYSADTYNDNQPISFHSGVSEQQRIREENAMRIMVEGQRRRSSAFQKGYDYGRGGYNEGLRNVCNQFAQQYYNTFGRYPNGSSRRESKKLWFLWILPLFVVAGLCRWVYANKEELVCRYKNALLRLGWLKEWLWSHRAELLTQDNLKKAKTYICRMQTKTLKIVQGPSRVCQVCGAENPERATICCNCGVAFECRKSNSTQSKKRRVSGPYSKLAKKRG